jgi:hypothetical protein
MRFLLTRRRRYLSAVFAVFNDDDDGHHQPAFRLLWVSMEATTLVSAPLIYFHRHHRSLEAT